MAKVEVQIRSCFCCGLTPGSIFIGIYTLLLFGLLAGLAAYALSDTANNGDSSYYRSCELEAEGKLKAEDRKFVFTGGNTKVVVEDSTSYHCSFGLYTEELKYNAPSRYPALLFNICLFVAIVFASVILLVGLCVYSQWFLLPWIFLMVIEIIRGIISVVFIFALSHGNLARIATGIFFLGLQFFHVSILLIIVAKFQRIHNHKRGIVVDPYDPRAYPPPSTYAYSPQQMRRDGPPLPMNARAGVDYPYSDYSPSQKDALNYPPQQPVGGYPIQQQPPQGYYQPSQQPGGIGPGRY